MDLLSNSGISIVQMPCPEVQFDGYDFGLARHPHGIRYYEKLPGFSQHCKELAQMVALQAVALEKKGYIIKAIIGIENSPTCAVNRIFTYGHGTEMRAGVFIEELKKWLNEMGMNTPFVGIIRHKKSQRKEIEKLIELFER